MSNVIYLLLAAPFVFGGCGAGAVAVKDKTNPVASQLATAPAGDVGEHAEQSKKSQEKRSQDDGQGGGQGHGHGDGKHHHPAEGETANQHMHHRSFDELVGRFENPKRATWQKPDLVLQKLGLVKGKTVVDIGAGTGYFSVRLAALGALVIAEDIDQRFLDYITQRLPNVKNGKSITPRLGAADDPKLEKASVDFALFVDVYHHIEQRRQYLEHVIEALRPGGKLLVVDFKPGDFPEGPPDALKLPVEEVVRELKEAGFTRIELDLAELPYQYLVQAGRP